jgi:hypothetical protein
MRNKSTWVTIPIAATIILLSTAFAQQPVPDIAQLVANAKTPADHQAIAAYYDQASKDALSQAELHRRLLLPYTANRPDYKPLPSHCKREIQYYAGLAKEDQTLAAAHRAMAKNPSQ